MAETLGHLSLVCIVRQPPLLSRSNLFVRAAVALGSSSVHSGTKGSFGYIIDGYSFLATKLFIALESLDGKNDLAFFGL